MSTSDPAMRRAAVRVWLDALPPEERAVMIERTERAMLAIAQHGAAGARHPHTALGSGVLPIGALVELPPRSDDWATGPVGSIGARTLSRPS